MAMMITPKEWPKIWGGGGGNKRTSFLKITSLGSEKRPQTQARHAQVKYNYRQSIEWKWPILHLDNSNLHKPKNIRETNSYIAQKLESCLSPMAFLNKKEKAYNLQNQWQRHYSLVLPHPSQKKKLLSIRNIVSKEE